MKKTSANEIRDLVFENYYKRIGYSKKNSYYSMKHLKKADLLLLANRLIEKLTDPRNAKEHYQEHYQRKKNRKPLVKQSGTITYQPKTFENPKINDITIIYYNDKKQLSQNTQKLCINYPRL